MIDDQRALATSREVMPVLGPAARTAWLNALGIDPQDLRGKIIAVAGWKGGIGKTLLAIELAYLFGAVLVDLDWDDGNASRALGYKHETRMNAPLLDALDRDRAPRPLSGGPFRPDFVPCHPDFVNNQPQPATMARALEKWAATWGEERNCPLVVDTHPGGVPSTFGAVSAAHVIVVPALLAEREMAALEGMVTELKSYPLILIPNLVPGSMSDRYIDWLEKIAASGAVPVGPGVGEYKWLRQRTRRMAVSASNPAPRRAQPLVAELHEVGEAVARYALAAV